MKIIIKIQSYSVLLIFALITSSAFAVEDSCPNKSQPLIGSAAYYICSFVAPGEMDTYLISVSKGDRVSVAVAALQAIDINGRAPTPRIKIIDPDGSLAVSRYDSNGVFADAIMDSDGLATIIVTDDYRKNTLQYSVKVNCTGYCGSDSLVGGDAYEEGYEDGLKISASNITASDKQDTCPLAQPIVSSGADYVCSFRGAGEMDVYRISVSKDDRVSVAVAVLAAFDDRGDTPTPRIRVIDPDGSLAVSRYDSNGVFADAIMDSDGLATIIVTDDYKQNTFQYSVKVNCTGFCSGSSDGDNYLKGYKDGLLGEPSGPVLVPGNIINISTRANIGGGQNDVYAGFVIDGTAPKRVILRGLSVTEGVDPTILILDHFSKEKIGQNDDWESSKNANEILALPRHLQLRKTTDAALLLDLKPGVYDVVLSSMGATGLGVVSVDEVPVE